MIDIRRMGLRRAPFDDMTTTPITPDLQRFIDDVGFVVAGTDDQHDITERVAPLLAALLASGYHFRQRLSSHRRIAT